MVRTARRRRPERPSNPRVRHRPPTRPHARQRRSPRLRPKRILTRIDRHRSSERGLARRNDLRATTPLSNMVRVRRDPPTQRRRTTRHTMDRRSERPPQVAWARTGPIGLGRRTLSAYWIGNQVVLQAGCFSGGHIEFVERCRDGGWLWPADRKDELSAECEAAAVDVIARLKPQIAALENQ